MLLCDSTSIYRQLTKVSSPLIPNPCPRPLPQGGPLHLSALVRQLAKRDTACEAAEEIAHMTCLPVAGNWRNWQDNLVKVTAGVVSPLVALLGAHSTVAVQKHAARALRNLAACADNQGPIAAAGAIPPLAALLGPASSAKVQEAAVGALRKLATNADNQAKMTAAGAIPLLVVLLGANNTAAVQEQAAAALGHISNNNEAKLIAAGAVPHLVALLGAQSPAPVQRAAAEALRCPQ